MLGGDGGHIYTLWYLKENIFFFLLLQKGCFHIDLAQTQSLDGISRRFQVYLNFTNGAYI